MPALPPNLDAVLEEALQKVRLIPGYLQESEARFLGVLAACAPAHGTIVEIGSFKGKSTVMLAATAQHYRLGQVVAIDPHRNTARTDPLLEKGESTFEEFLTSLRSAGVDSSVEVHRACSREVAEGWSRPIRLLWIDGDHTYAGVKTDFEGFAPFVVDGGIVALHDALHGYEGPIRIFVEEMLRSDRFGPAGFVKSIAWGQVCLGDGALFRKQREKLVRRAGGLVPLLANDNTLRGLTRLRYNLIRARVPRAAVSPAEWLAMVSQSAPNH